MNAAEHSMLLRIWQFLNEEADQRDSVGSEMSDYAREPRELADEVQGFLDSWNDA